MIARLLPARFDNVFPGHRIALWLFGLILFVRTGIALGMLFDGRNAAQSPDGIPLSTFGEAGAAAVVSAFAMWGLAQTALNAAAWIAVWRYRSMVPLLFAVFLVEHLLRRALLIWFPMPRIGTPPGFWINMAVIAVTAIGVGLSLRRPVRETPHV